MVFPLDFHLIMVYLAWPLAALIGVVFALFIFKKPLERLIDRISGIDKAGVHTSAKAQEQETSIERRQSAADEMMAAFDNDMILQQEAIIKNEFAVKKITDCDEREKVLLRYLATTITYLQFERIYQNIFGTQISLLQNLNSTQSSREDLEHHYQMATILHPDFYIDYSSDQYIQYLLNNLLIRTDDGQTFGITLRGREFLKFMIQDGLTFNKLG